MFFWVKLLSLRSWKCLIRKSSNFSIIEASNIFSSSTKCPSEAVDNICSPLEFPSHKRHAIDKCKLLISHSTSGVVYSPLSYHENFSTPHWCLSKSRGCHLAILLVFMGIEKLWGDDLFSCSSLDLEDIKIICDSFDFISFVGIYLWCNRATSALASFAKENEDIIVWLEEYPFFLFPVV